MSIAPVDTKTSKTPKRRHARQPEPGTPAHALWEVCGGNDMDRADCASRLNLPRHKPNNMLGGQNRITTIWVAENEDILKTFPGWAKAGESLKALAKDVTPEDEARTRQRVATRHATSEMSGKMTPEKLASIKQAAGSMLRRLREQRQLKMDEFKGTLGALVLRNNWERIEAADLTISPGIYRSAVIEATKKFAPLTREDRASLDQLSQAFQKAAADHVPH